jgi:hypothetical protein
VTLSGQLMTASLAMIAVEGAFTTFALDKRVTPSWFPFIVGAAVLLFVFSIVAGGAGISALSKAGHEGDWNLDRGKADFRRQTVSCLLGLVFFFLSLFLSGPSREQSFERDLKALRDRVQTPEGEPNLPLQIEGLRNDLKSAKDELAGLRSEVEKLKATRPQITARRGRRAARHSTKQ